MAKPGLLSLLYLIFILELFVSANGKSNNCRQKKKHVAFFIFGDSFLDAGNNNYINTSTLDQANFWPYGETYFKFPTGRFSDGRLISDFIADKAKLPLIPPFLQSGSAQYYNGVNFASAGAGALVETFQGSVIDLKMQLEHFKKVTARLRQTLGHGEAQRTISNAVYLFSIGTNDYMGPLLTNSTIILHNYSHSVYVRMVIFNLTSIIKEVYHIGGRKFGIINVPPLGCLPGIRVINTNGSCLEEASKFAKLHNQALINQLYKLEKQLKGFRYYLFDFHKNLGERMSHPTRYGFIEGEEACCGTGPYRGVFSCGGKRPVKEFKLCESPSHHVFWDSFHLTEKANEQLAAHMWSGLGDPHRAGPNNLERLFRLGMKCIVNRHRPLLNSIVVPFQSSFIHGPNTVDNILLTQDIMAKNEIQDMEEGIHSLRN